MKQIIFIFALFIYFGSHTQEVKEVIKIDIDEACKGCIRKRTYIDEIFTNNITVIRGVFYKVNLSFAYHENFMFDRKGSMIYFHFDQDIFKDYETKNIFLNIDGTEHKLNELCDFIKSETINGLAEIVYIYSLGYVIDSKLANSLKDPKIIKLELLNSISKKRKSWELSTSEVAELVKTYNCFEKYYLPIEKRHQEERSIVNKEYEKTLKSYNTDFRNSKWFDSKETVKKSNPEIINIDNSDALGYKVQLNNDDFSAFYYFNKDRLYQGVYLLEEEYVNENNFYSKYLELKNVLISKYGEPKKVNKYRNRDLWNKANEIGMAIQTGEYQEYTYWETKTSTIKLIIEGENFDSKITIRYNTKDPSLSTEVKSDNNVKKVQGF